MKRSGCLTVWLLGAVSLPAQAASFAWDAVEAVSDAYYGPGNHHALWMVGLVGGGHARDWFFDAESGRFVYDDSTGIARLSGSIFNETDTGLSGDIGFDFQQNPLGGKPKQELVDGAYTENGGPVDTSTWRNFDTTDGSFTGTGALAGLIIDYRQRPALDPDDPGRHRGQLGLGASGKNIDFGLSSWFYWSVSGCVDDSGNDGCAPLGLTLTSQDIGDININLVPLPAAFWLFGSALVGLCGLHRFVRPRQTPDGQAPTEILA